MSIQRTFRDSTVEQRNRLENEPVVHPHRRNIPVGQTPTRLHLPGVCTHNKDAANDKVQRAVFHFFIRFLAADLWQCDITRVSTDSQSGHSHCGNCECAHYASNIRDNKMPLVLDAVLNLGEISPNKFSYLNARLGLGSPEKKQLENLKESDEKVAFLRSLVSPNSMRNSFSKTAYGKNLSSTIEGPIASNDLDQGIEVDFKPFEDDLCNQVTAKKVPYKEATAIAFQKLTQILTQAISNLKTRIDQLTKLRAIEAVMDQIENKYTEKNEISDQDLKDYMASVEKFLKLRSKILAKQKYSVNLNMAKSHHFTERNDFFWLKSFQATVEEISNVNDQKSAFKMHMKHVKKTPIDGESIALKKARTRLLEAEGQLEGLDDIGECNLGNLELWLFGINEGGKRRAPTEEELFNQLIEMTKKETPPKRVRKKNKSEKMTIEDPAQL